MNKQTIIENILTIYGKYGVTQEDIEPLIDESIEDGFSYDRIYFFLQLTLTDVCGLDFFGVQRVRWEGYLEERMKKCLKS